MTELAPYKGIQAHPMRQPILDMVWHRYHQTPRHLQVELGPSEIGESCDRKLAMAIMHEPKFNEGDPLPSIVGTAAHTWMDGACQMWNEHLGRTRFVPELEIPIRNGQVGHCDCLDLDTMTILDWKFVGQEPLRDYKRNGPSEVYRRQAHMYGYGFHRNLKIPIKHVAIVFFPRGGMLSGLHIWSEPYNEQLALETFERYDNITEMCVALDVEHHPENYKIFTKNAGHRCRYCSWFQPGDDTGQGCPGFTNEK